MVDGASRVLFSSDALNPEQQRVLDRLGAKAADRPEFDRVLERMQRIGRNHHRRQHADAGFVVERQL